MKFIGLHIHNVIGARKIDIAPMPRVSLFVGVNGAGKTSIANAIRFAMGGGPERVRHKNEFALLMTEGARNGSVQIDFEAMEPALFALPSGKQTSPIGHLSTAFGDPKVIKAELALPYTLDARAFSRATPDTRRKLLLALLEVELKGRALAQDLLDRGHDPEAVKQLGAELELDVQLAFEAAKARASEARGAWKQLTGQTYGSVKAASWCVTGATQYDEQVLAQARSDLEAAQATYDQERQGLEVARAARSVHETAVRKHRELTAAADLLPRRKEAWDANTKLWQEERAKLEALEASASGRPPVPQATPPVLVCPHCQGPLVYSRGALVAYVEPPAPPPDFDPDIEKKLAAQRGIEASTRRAMDNSKRDYDQALTAQAALKAMGPPEPVMSDEAIAELDQKLAQKKAVVGAFAQAVRDQEWAQRAEDTTAQATALHTQVSQWEAIAQDLAPGGLPGEALAHSVEVLNARIAETRILTEYQGDFWGVVRVDETTMTVYYNKRPYDLLSTGEQVRADILVTEALSHLSGLKFMLIDGVDILDTARGSKPGEEEGGRQDLLTLLNALAAAGDIDTAVLMMTNPTRPTEVPPLVGAFLIEHGEIVKNSEPNAREVA